MPSESGDMGVPGAQAHRSQDTMTAAEEEVMKTKEFVEGPSNGNANHSTASQNLPPGADKDARTRKTSRAAEPFDQAEREEMERLLEELRGHLGESGKHSYPPSLWPLICENSLVSNSFLGR